MPTTSTCTVVGVFDDDEAAQRAVDSLTADAFRRDEIEVSRADEYPKAALGTGKDVTGSQRSERESGGIGGFFRWLVGADVDEEDRGIYAEAVRRGNTVVTVTTDESKQDLAADIMDENGAIDVDRRLAWWKERGYTAYDPAAAPYAREDALRERQEYYRDDGGSRTIPVVKEEIRVGKQAVQRGGVGVYNRITEQPAEHSVKLREEHVRVRPARGRPARHGSRPRQTRQVIEVTEMAEEPVVEKRMRVVEEVVVGKEANERTQTIRDKVRRSDVKVERVTAGSDPNGYEEDFRRDFKTRFGTDRSATYETYAPAYDYGYRMASDQRYRGKNWDEVEHALRTDYERNNPNSTWDRMKGAVRYGWEKVTGRR